MSAFVLILVAILLWFGFDATLVGLRYLSVRAVERHEAANRAARLRLAAGRHDPAKTAGGSAGKSYSGGWGRDAYYIPGETTITPTRAERLP